MTLRKKGTAHLSAKLKKDLGSFPCRYCEHLVDVRPPRTRHYIGGCEYHLRPGPRGGCNKFEMAKCFKK